MWCCIKPRERVQVELGEGACVGDHSSELIAGHFCGCSVGCVIHPMLGLQQAGDVSFCSATVRALLRASQLPQLDGVYVELGAA